LGPEEINNTCGRTTHMGMIDRGLRPFTLARITTG